MKCFVNEYRWVVSLKPLQKGILAIVLVLVAIYFVGASNAGGDFASYIEAAAKMKNGQNIYAPPYIHLRYSYSPFWAMVLMPLTSFPAPVIIFLWLILSVIWLLRTIYLLRNYFGFRYTNPKTDLLFWCIVLLLLSRFIELNFHHSQMTIFLLWVILESIRLSNENNQTYAGILIGLGTIIKIIPIAIIPYLIYRKKFVAAITSIIVFVAAFYLPILYLGRTAFAEINHTWFQILRPDSTDFITDNADYFAHNLSALLYRLLMETNAPYIHNILNLDYLTATKVVWLFIIMLILFTLYFLSSKPFSGANSLRHVIYEIAYILLITPLIFPHQMKYAFYFILPAVCCLVKYIIDEYETRSLNSNVYYFVVVMLTLFCILAVSTTDLFIGMKLSIVTQYLKTITLGTLLLIPALALIKKHYIES